MGRKKNKGRADSHTAAEKRRLATKKQKTKKRPKGNPF